MSALHAQLKTAEEAVRLAEVERDRLRKLWRRECQAKDLAEGAGSPDKPVSWLGDIGMFVDDLDYHTVRLGKAIYAEFNGHRIVTNPNLKENAIALDAYNQWRDQFHATR